MKYSINKFEVNEQEVFIDDSKINSKVNELKTNMLRIYPEDSLTLITTFKNKGGYIDDKGSVISDVNSGYTDPIYIPKDYYLVV
jgi:hypothetical protein